MIKELFFEPLGGSTLYSLILLLVRIVFGGMLIIHGWGKLKNFKNIAPQFTGGKTGLSLAIFAEVFCSAGVVAGVCFRLALIPMIITMCVAFFGAHKGKIVGKNNGEMALLYLIIFIMLFILGPGIYAGDTIIASWF